MELKTHFHDSKTSKQLSSLTQKILTQSFPPEIGIWSFCLKVILMLLLFPQMSSQEQRFLTALKLQRRILGA